MELVTKEHVSGKNIQDFRLFLFADDFKSGHGRLLARGLRRLFKSSRFSEALDVLMPVFTPESRMREMISATGSRDQGIKSGNSFFISLRTADPRKGPLEPLNRQKNNRL
jgi:hypothetical protein